MKHVVDHVNYSGDDCSGGFDDIGDHDDDNNNDNDSGEDGGFFGNGNLILKYYLYA